MAPATQDGADALIRNFVATVSSIRYYGEPWLQEVPDWFGGRAKKAHFLDLMTALGYAVLYEEMAHNWWWLKAANEAQIAILDKPEVRQNRGWFRHCVKEFNRRVDNGAGLKDSLDTFLELVGTPFCETFGYRRGKVPDGKIKVIARFTNHIHNSFYTTFNNEIMHHWKAPSPQMIAERKLLGTDIDADIPP